MSASNPIVPKGAAANPAPPTVAKVRIRFAKRGRLRFASHRDVARAFERAVRRARLPVAHSHGFSPRPRLSWVGAAPTGAASEAEYVEIGLTENVPSERVATDLDGALPTGLDVLDAVAVIAGGPALADLIEASAWRIELPGVPTAELTAAVDLLLAVDSLIVQRTTKSGMRPVDVRSALVSMDVEDETRAESRTPRTGGQYCAILTTVVRQTTPAVRPDDVLSALRVVAGLGWPVPAVCIRLAQGLLDDRGRLADPFGAHRVATPVAPGGWCAVAYQG